MKAKSYGLADLATLKKHLEQKTRIFEQQLAEQQLIQEHTCDSVDEFKLAIKNVIPLKNHNRYIHPSRELKLPEPKKNHVPHHTTRKSLKDELSDGFDARHLRNDDLGVYLRKGVPECLLKKLQKGFWPIALRLDLHSKHTEEARIATSAFLYQAIQHRARAVLIIHGQGYGSQTGHAVLKHHVKNWLVQNNHVLAFCSAPANMGGRGAVLVLLHDTPR